MPRFSRNYYNKLYFHIIVQGTNKTHIFRDTEDKNYYAGILYSLKNEYNINIVGYCIMRDHAHMILNVKNVKNISQFLHRANTKYALYYNKKNDRVRYVFRRRYKIQEIYSEEQLNNCILYIYNNPVRAGICKKPENYKFSSCKEVIEDYEEFDKYTFIDTNEDYDDKELSKRIIDKFLNDNNANMAQVKLDNATLRKLIILMKSEYGISLRKIAGILNMNREKVRYLYKGDV